MTQLLIKSDTSELILQLIRRAIDEQIKMLQHGIERAKELFEEFEKKYGIKTEEFYKKFETGEMGDNSDYIEWAGEYELLSKLVRDYEKLKEVEICT